MTNNKNIKNSFFFVVLWRMDEYLNCFFWKSSRHSYKNGDNLVQMNGGNENLFDVKYKVLLLGDTLVGKTSLQRFIAGKDFRTDIGATIGT